MGLGCFFFAGDLSLVDVLQEFPFGNALPHTLFEQVRLWLNTGEIIIGLPF